VISGVAVVDASAVVEYLVELQLAEQASGFFAGLVAEPALEIWAPDLIYPETVSALRKVVQRRAIDADAGRRAVERLVRLPLVATGTAGLMVEAWALRRSVTPYDACYLALAGRLNAPFVTADARLARGQRGRTPRVLFLGDLAP
jgi:predicted nucleic acid-binding protein